MWNVFKRLKRLEEKVESMEYDKLDGELDEIMGGIDTPERVMESVLGRDISWFDFNELPYAERVSYWNDAQAIIKNNVFLNEYNHFITFLMKEMSKDMDVEQIKYARFGIVALEAFKEHLESIDNPDKHQTTNDVYDGI